MKSPICVISFILLNLSIPAIYNVSALPPGVYCVGPSSSYAPPVGVTYQNGSSPFQNLSQAIASLNANDFTGSVIFEIQNDYTSLAAAESFPLIITFQGNPSNTATFRPRIDVPAMIFISGSIPSSNNTTGLIELNGADYVTFDGSPGGVMGSTIGLTVRNQSSNIVANFMIRNDAQHNTINAIASDAAGSARNIYINGTNGPEGNDFLTILNCELFNHGIGSALCESMIAAAGTGSGNSASNDLVIESNKMWNSERGVYLLSSVNGNINISNNSFFGYVLSSLPRLMHYGIYVSSTELTHTTIEGNFYGGTAAMASGSNLWVTDAGAVYGILVLNQQPGSTNAINNNIIRNVDVGNLQLNSGFNGIFIAGPATISNNTIGDLNNPASINLYATNIIFADFKGITIVNSFFGANSTITGNTIQNVVFGAASTVNATFTGIYYPNTLSPHTVTVSGNLIRNLVSNNKIVITGIDLRGSNQAGSNTIAQDNKIESISTFATAIFNGINVISRPCIFTGNRIGKFNTPDDIKLIGNGVSYGFSLSGNGGLLIAEDDTVSNITLQSSGTYSFTGMSVDNNGAFPHLTQRILVRDIKTSSLLTGSITSGHAGFALTGIHWYGGSSASQQLQNCVIENISAVNFSVSSAIAGIFCTAPGIVSKNIVRQIQHTGTSFPPHPVIVGIQNSGSNNTLHNNMISLAGNLANATEYYGMHDAHTSGTNKYFFNSISISGNSTSAFANTYTFFRSGTGGNFEIRNNIFQNSRTGGNKNYAIGLVNGNISAWPAGSSNHNSFYASNISTVAEYGTGSDKSFNGWQTITSGDSNSIYFDATFIDPATDLHLAPVVNCSLKGAGIASTGITTDFDNDTRLSSPTIGADEFSSPCDITFNLKAFIQGYYRNSAMLPVLFSFGASTDPDACDTIHIEFRNVAPPYSSDMIISGILRTDGSCSVTIPGSKLGMNFYIVLKHRSALETWSAAPFYFGSLQLSYDFSTAASQAYNSNQVSLGSGVFGLYNGDVADHSDPGIQDGLIDLHDLSAIETACEVFDMGYILNDLTGDLTTESDDLSLFENNISVSVQRP